MKIILKGIGKVFYAVGGVIILCLGITTITYGPKKTWRLLKDSFCQGYNYKF